MNEKLKNFLFLAMQGGGNVSPQMKQQAQQTGNLPMMQMGNDIQKMNQKQAAHYGYFQAGGQQEQVDQDYMSPMVNYSQRVSDFLRNLKEQAMSAVQDEMVDTNEAYAEEADAISGMPMAQYGVQYNEAGLDAAKAWEAMANNQRNMLEPIINTAGMATGLKGYFGNENAFNANPYNEQYIKKVKYKDIKGTQPVIPIEAPVNAGVSETKTYAPGKNYAPGGEAPAGTQVVTNPDGTQSSISPNEVARRKAEADKKKAEEEAAKKAAEDAQKKAEAEDSKTVGDGYDYLRGYADPESTQAGAVYTTDKRGNQVPLAFYDPNLRVMSTTADYRNTLGNLFRGEDKKKRGSLKSFTVRYGTLADGTQVPIDDEGNVIQQPPITQSPNVNDLTGATVVSPAGNQTPVWNPINQPNLPQVPVTQIGDIYTNTGGKTLGPTISMDNLNPSGSTVVPKNAQTEPALTESQKRKIDKASKRADKKVAELKAKQAAINAGSVVPQQQTTDQQNTITQPLSLDQQVLQKFNQLPQTGVSPIGGTGMANVRQNVQNLIDNKYYEDAMKRLQGYGYAKGGQLGKFIRQYAGGGPGTSPATNLYNFTDEADQLLADQGPIDPDTGLPIESPFDQPLMTDADRARVVDNKFMPLEEKKNKMFTNIKEAKYTFGKDNPFFAPAMLAGLEGLAGAAQNRDARSKERELRGRLAFDQIGFKVPQTSGSQGDWTVNEGYIRPNDYVPVQFQGAGPLAQMGGSLNEGDELYLDDETINAILAAGGQIEYLD